LSATRKQALRLASADKVKVYGVLSRFGSTDAVELAECELIID
jgi:hypothetical protein